MIIDSIRNYMLSCPLLEGEKINVNCLGQKAVAYTIDSVAENPLIKRYCDGGTLKQYKFIFALRDVYDEIISENIRIANFFEQLAAWIENQNTAGILPNIDDERCIAEKIEVTKNAYLLESSIDSMRYQMELRLVYRQER